MKKVLSVLKYLMVRTAVIYMFVSLFFGAVGAILITPEFSPLFMFSHWLFSLSIAAAWLIFRVEKIPVLLKYVVNFSLFYGGFIAFEVIMTERIQTPGTVPVLSIAFTVLYLIGLAAVTAVKSIAKAVKNSRTDYNSQFDMDEK